MKQGKLTESLPPGKAKSKLKATLDPVPHGGREARGKPKTPRPFTPKTSLHNRIEIKTILVRGWMKHRKNQSKITSMVYVYSARFRCMFIVLQMWETTYIF